MKRIWLSVVCVCVLAALLGGLPLAKKRKKPTSLERVYWRSLVYRLRVKNRPYRRAIGRELRRRGEVRALPYVLGMLRKKSRPEQRRGALVALAQWGIPWTVTEVLARLKDPAPGVRREALRSLASICKRSRCKTQKPRLYRRIRKLLLERMQKGRSAEVRAALWALSRLEDPSALAAVRAAYARPKPKTALHYSRTLAALGDATKRRTWRGLLKTRKKWVFRRLASWPGRWSSRLLVRGFEASRGRAKRRAAWSLLRRLDAIRTRALQKACKGSQLGPRQCRKIRKAIQTHAKAFPKTSRPYYLRSRQSISSQHLRLSKKLRGFGPRLEGISRLMLGTPYVLDPLGEGPKGRYDKDPTFTFRRADCVTFIEQVLALAHVAQLSKAMAFAQKIRYDQGRIDYRYRRHLPIAQWIPAMIKMKLAKDVTAQVGGSQTRYLTKRLDRKAYSTREGRRLMRRLGKERVVFGSFRLAYLTHDVALAKLSKIPPGTVLSSLRGANPYSPGQVTHQGLIVKYGGTLYMRHASSVWRSVVDVPLKSYLRILKKYPRPRIGIHLLQLTPRPTPKSRK